MRRCLAMKADIPIYDRNDISAPSFVIVTACAIHRAWCSSGGAEYARHLLSEIAARGEAIEHAWINPGPNFVSRGAHARPILQAAE